MKKYLKENGYIFYYKYPLKNITTIRNNGLCKYFIIINNYKELINLIKYLKRKSMKYFIIGNGSKVIFRKDYNGVIISIKNLNKVVINELVEVEAGCMLSTLIYQLKKESLGGIENLIGIPATIGGALKNNASAHGVCLYDYLEYLLIFKNNKVIKINKEQIAVNYRKTSLKDCVILKCYFRFERRNKQLIKENIEKFIKYRKNVQEISYPNIGSIFKNNTYKAYELIKKCHLENFCYKNVCFSQKHLNFLLIKGETNGKYIYQFVKKIKSKVYKRTKIKLETEIIFK